MTSQFSKLSPIHQQTSRVLIRWLMLHVWCLLFNTTSTTPNWNGHFNLYSSKTNRVMIFHGLFFRYTPNRFYKSPAQAPIDYECDENESDEEDDAYLLPLIISISAVVFLAGVVVCCCLYRNIVTFTKLPAKNSSMNAEINLQVHSYRDYDHSWLLFVNKTCVFTQNRGRLTSTDLHEEYYNIVPD